MRETQPRRCSTFIKHRVLRFRITTWRQMRAMRLDWKLLSPAHRDNEQCHACKSSLSLGDREPALSIRTSIIKIVVGPISGDVFPWIVNASCRHFYPCHIALEHTLKVIARREFVGKMDHLNVYWSCRSPEKVWERVWYFRLLHNSLLLYGTLRWCVHTHKLDCPALYWHTVDISQKWVVPSVVNTESRLLSAASAEAGTLMQSGWTGWVEILTYDE